MNFVNPMALFWLGLIPLIVLLYFLKLKRREIPISSTYLWKKSVMDLHVNAPFQRLRKNILLLLQILILAAAIFALAQPFLDVRGFERQSMIVLLDRSASMNARVGNRTRLDEAKKAAESLVADMSAGDQMAIIAFSTAADVVSPFSRSKSALRQAIRKITPGEGRTDIDAALEVASNLARLRQNPEVALISDGRFPAGSEIGLQRVNKFTYLSVGESAPNLAITALDLRRGLEMGGDVEAFVRVENFSPSAQTATVILKLNGREFDAREVDIPAGGSASRLFGGLGDVEGILEASIEHSAKDALAADDRAIAILVKQERLRVILATKWGYFFEKDLKLDPDVDYGKIGEEEVAAGGPFVLAGSLPADVVILDGMVPETLSPGGYLIVGQVPPIEGFAIEGELEDPVALDWNSSHPAMRFVNLENLWVNKAAKLAFPKAARVLVESQEGPLILSYESQGVRLICLAFDVRQTNWPLRVSFPIFLSNALRWLAGRDRSELSRQALTGGVLPISAGPEVSVTVETPSGRDLRVESSGTTQRFFNRTEEVGLYTIHYPEDRVEQYAVNLLSSAESDLEPAKKITVSDQEVEATIGEIRTNREIWWPLILTAFLVLLLEWYIYNRRVQI
ncbi:MAG: VWA domain-containing protein [Planctomycetota bacterium]|nr:VWA domain-containing protein [Planctomycetota bacterium]